MHEKMKCIEFDITENVLTALLYAQHCTPTKIYLLIQTNGNFNCNVRLLCSSTWDEMRIECSRSIDKFGILVVDGGCDGRCSVWLLLLLKVDSEIGNFCASMQREHGWNAYFNAVCQSWKNSFDIIFELWILCDYCREYFCLGNFKWIDCLFCQ